MSIKRKKIKIRFTQREHLARPIGINLCTMACNAHIEFTHGSIEDQPCNLSMYVVYPNSRTTCKEAENLRHRHADLQAISNTSTHLPP
jgi:hypothetical protein